MTYQLKDSDAKIVNTLTLLVPRMQKIKPRTQIEKIIGCTLCEVYGLTETAPWLYTGGIGKFDQDGYLTIVDRKKDMIIAGGCNIYPVEIDDVLFEHPK